jgi:hypothetical protein
MSLTPEISGHVGIQSPTSRFLPAFEKRVTAGLLTGRPHPRSNYQVVASATDGLTIQAADWWTAFNVGLNDVELRLSQPGAVQYRVRYWRWAWYCVALCGALGLIGIVLLLTTDARAYMEDTVVTAIPGLSADQHVLIAWGMAIFWGFVWPWIMIATHKRPLHTLMTRLIREVDARAVSPAS